MLVKLLLLVGQYSLHEGHFDVNSSLCFSKFDLNQSFRVFRDNNGNTQETLYKRSIQFKFKDNIHNSKLVDIAIYNPVET